MGRRTGLAPKAHRDRRADLTRLLLDTTFLIDAERAGDNVDEVIDDDDDVAIAAITAAELRVGVLLSKGKRRTARQAFLDDVLATIPVRDYDLHVAAVHAELLVEVRKQGLPRGAHDLLIAATARTSERTVLTAETTSFENLPGVPARTHRRS